MKSNKTTGWLLLTGAAGVFIPYTILTITFNYPDILRQEPAVILSKFHQAGSSLVWTWFSFALAGLPLIPAYLLVGKKLEQYSQLTRIATSIGIIGLVVQLIGLLRWTFVIPVLASGFVDTTDPATQSAIIVAFKTIHQFAGVLLGEHLGQLFTITWTVLITTVLIKSKMIPRWMAWLGYTSSLIYLFSQAELLATVLPGFPVWDMAGFIGSTLWLLWLILLGIRFLKNKN